MWRYDAKWMWGQGTCRCITRAEWIQCIHIEYIRYRTKKFPTCVRTQVTNGSVIASSDECPTCNHVCRWLPYHVRCSPYRGGSQGLRAEAAHTGRECTRRHCTAAAASAPFASSYFFGMNSKVFAFGTTHVERRLVRQICVL